MGNVKLLERQISGLTKQNNTLLDLLIQERKTSAKQRQTLDEHDNIFKSIATLCRKQAD